MAGKKKIKASKNQKESDYTNLAFVLDEHEYGTITSYSLEKRSVGTGFNFLRDKRLVLLISVVIILVITAVVVPVSVVLTRKSDDDYNVDEESVRWNTWSEWTECSVTCGIGVSERSRVCKDNDDSVCEGSEKQTEVCELQKCAEESLWSSWGEWTECTVSCGVGSYTRSRKCTADVSSRCVGEHMQTDVCSAEACPDELLWLSWGDWTKCSVSCDVGFHTRYRKCTADASSRCVGEYVQTDACSAGACPGRGKWTTWTAWGSCDASCGGGQKTRTRDCVKDVAADFDCIGEESQQTECNDFLCPDCSKICDVGQLNEDCTACVCLDNVVRGRILSAETDNAISNAAFYDVQAPTRVLTLSNNTGFFEATTVCSTTSLLVKKHGFLDLTARISDSFLDLWMENTVHPYFTEAPQSRVRLKGEDVMLCCKADGKPNITYYEWFKDSYLIDQTKNLDNNGTRIILVNLSTSDTGNYQCRANSEVGAIMSEPATVSVEGDQDNFCVDALRQKSVDLPSDCVQSATNTASFEVGQCVHKSCRRPFATDALLCQENTGSCCIVSESRLEQVNCTGYSLDIIVTVSCGCGECQIGNIVISGLVLGLDTGEPIRFATVKINGEVTTYTSIAGQFQLTTNENFQTVVLSVEDYYQQYLPTTKIVELSGGLSGSLNVNINMLPVPEPQILDSTVDSNLFAGLINDATPKVELAVPANSFYYANGSQYQGKVKAKLTYLDPVNLTIYDSIPGTFQYTNEEGVERDLDTLGVFNLVLRSEDGQKLGLSEVVDAYIPGEIETLDSNNSFKLWSLNTQSGLWEDATVFQPIQRRKRSKRETARWIGQFEDVSEQKWYNYDRVSNISPSLCYFMIRLFKDPSLKETVDKPDRNIYLRIHIKKNETLHTIKHTIRTISSYVVSAVCDGDEALIRAYTYVRNSEYTLYVSSPSSPSIVNFSIASDERSIKIMHMYTSNSGPFYSSKTIGNSYIQFYYGVTDENSWLYLAEPLTQRNCNTPVPNDSHLRWYTYSEELYLVCTVKVRINIDMNANIGTTFNVKLRSMSYVCSKVVGIHEQKLILSKANLTQTVCLEFRCSGQNNVCSKDDYLTHVKISVEHDNKYVHFSVAQQATDLTKDCGQYSLNRACEHSIFANYNQTGRDDGAFEFCAPITDGSEYLGLYTKSSKGIGLAHTNSVKYCETTRSDGQGNNKPGIGLAVTFVGE